MNESDAPQSPAISALDVRRHLVQLENERALALQEGLGNVRAYMSAIDEELEHWRARYVGAAVTEIATLRGELFGRQFG
jgi:hypothetical protein